MSTLNQLSALCAPPLCKSHYYCDDCVDDDEDDVPNTARYLSPIYPQPCSLPSLEIELDLLGKIKSAYYLVNCIFTQPF